MRGFDSDSATLAEVVKDIIKVSIQVLDVAYFLNDNLIPDLFAFPSLGLQFIEVTKVLCPILVIGLDHGFHGLQELVLYHAILKLAGILDALEFVLEAGAVGFVGLDVCDQILGECVQVLHL